jgi:predicted DNA-binding protein (MmcQ/YjbR family)
MSLEEIREICTSLPHVTEDIKWGHDLCFLIASKMFCVVGLDESPVNASFKVKEEDFDEISSREGFMPAPYMARHKWVYIDDISRLSKEHWKEMISTSYELVKAKLPQKIKNNLA